MSLSQLNSTLFLTLNDLRDMSRPLSEMKIGEIATFAVRVRVTALKRRSMKAIVEEAIPENYVWGTADPFATDPPKRSESLSMLSVAYLARENYLRLIPKPAHAKLPPYRFTIKMALMEHRYLEGGLAGGSRNGYRAPAWNNERVNRLCNVMNCSLWELAGLCLITKREIRRYYRQNSWPSSVCLHFQRYEQSVAKQVGAELEDPFLAGAFWGYPRLVCPKCRSEITPPPAPQPDPLVPPPVQRPDLAGSAPDQMDLE